MADLLCCVVYAPMISCGHRDRSRTHLLGFIELLHWSHFCPTYSTPQCIANASLVCTHNKNKGREGRQ